MQADRPATAFDVLNVVCEALKSINFNWRFSTRKKDPEPVEIDGNFMVVSTPDNQTQFFAFFYSVAAQDESGPQQLQYAIDFGVKKQRNLSHLVSFDAITDAYEAILSAVKTRQLNAKDSDSIRVQLLDQTPWALAQKLQQQTDFSVAVDRSELSSRSQIQILATSQSRLSNEDAD